MKKFKKLVLPLAIAGSILLPIGLSGESYLDCQYETSTERRDIMPEYDISYGTHPLQNYNVSHRGS